jgi:quercetin dioxygenase-like cupin family protein
VRYFLRAVILWVGCFAFSAFGISSGLAQVPGGTAPQEPGKIEFENDAITVVRMHMAPHATTPMHDMTARLVIWLTDARLRDTSADGWATEYVRSAGAVDWIEPRRHMGENLSNDSLEFLAIIPKAAAGPGAHHPH